jgi:hypothetical protein
METKGGGRRATWSAPEHVISERKRREKMHHQFATLASIIPDVTKVSQPTASCIARRQRIPSDTTPQGN